jgi:hypothetical protein
MSFLINPYAFAAPVGPTDPYFANVSLLLHGDGANGSTTIVDSSPSPKTVTAFGNAQISTAQSKFGGSSLLCGAGASAGYFTTPLTSDFQFGTGDFTFEAWLYPTATGGFKTALCNYTTFNTSAFLLSRSVAADTTKWSFTSGAYPPTLKSTTNAVDNVWTFIAVVRSGSTITLFVNGIPEGSITSSFSANGNGPSLWIGAAGDTPLSTYFSGYIDELRITKGIARYQSAFTPPTAPFPDA